MPLFPNRPSFLRKVKLVEVLSVLLLVIISFTITKSLVALRQTLVNSSLIMSSLTDFHWFELVTSLEVRLDATSTWGACGILQDVTGPFRLRIGEAHFRRGVKTLFGTKLNFTILGGFRGSPP